MAEQDVFKVSKASGKETSGIIETKDPTNIPNMAPESSLYCKKINASDKKLYVTVAMSGGKMIIVLIILETWK